MKAENTTQPSAYAIGKAGSAWTTPETSHIEMDTRLGYAFARIIDDILDPFKTKKLLNKCEEIDCIIKQAKELADGTRGICEGEFAVMRFSLRMLAFGYDDVKDKTAEELLEKHCPGFNKLFMDDNAKQFYNRILQAMYEFKTGNGISAPIIEETEEIKKYRDEHVASDHLGTLKKLDEKQREKLLNGYWENYVFTIKDIKTLESCRSLTPGLYACIVTFKDGSKVCIDLPNIEECDVINQALKTRNSDEGRAIANSNIKDHDLGQGPYKQ